MKASFRNYSLGAGVLLLLLCTACGGTKTLPALVLPQVNSLLFATGAAPNDIAFSNGALFVANSMDNTVTKHNLQGTVEATHSFPTFSSPSFLLADGTTIWAVCNGTNTLTGLSSTDLLALPEAAFQFEAGTAAFDGPASPLAAAGSVFVPRNRIASFGPTTYSEGIVTRCTPGGVMTDITTQVSNPGFAAYHAASGLLYVVCTGDIQFDANFVPYANGDAMLEVFDVNASNSRVAGINLGPTGAQRIALSSDGRFAYLANALNGNIYKVNLETRNVERSVANPIVLTTDFTYVSDVQFTPDGQLLLATSFNTDELFALDPDTDSPSQLFSGPVQLDGGNALLSGAQRMAIGPATASGSSARVYVAMSIANCIASVDLP